MATIKQIADMVGVSRGTVDRVLNNRPGVNAQKADEIRRVAELLDYRPNYAGKLLSSLKKVHRIGFMAYDNPREGMLFQDILRAVDSMEEELRTFGVELITYRLSSRTEAFYKGVFERIDADALDGLVVAPYPTSFIIPPLRRLEERGLPMVFYNVDDSSFQKLCYVGCDYERSGRVAAGLAALLARPGEKIGVFTIFNTYVQSYVSRVKGFKDELSSHYPMVEISSAADGIVFDNGEFGKACRIIKDNPDITVAYVVNPGDFEICAALQGAAEGRGLKIITNDHLPKVQALLDAGIVTATIGQHHELQGTLPLKILRDYLLFGKAPPLPQMLTELGIYIRQNA